MHNDPIIGEMPPLPDTTQLVLPEILPAQPEALKNLLTLCNAMDAALGQKDSLEEQVKANEERIKHLSTKLIPDMMASIGMNEITLVTGRKISIKPDIKANVSKERMAAVLAWLKDKGMDSIAKQYLKVEPQFAEAIEQAGVGFTREATIHPSTLLSFVKEQLAAEDNTNFPRELFGVYEGTKAVTTTTR